MTELIQLFSVIKKMAVNIHPAAKLGNTEIHCKTTGEVPSQIWRFTGVKTILINPFNVNVVGKGCLVRQLFVTGPSAVEIKLTEMQEVRAP